MGTAAMLAGGVLAPGGPASASPRDRIEQVQAQVRQLESDAESASELANAARVKLQAIQDRIAVLDKRLAAAKTAVGDAVGTVDSLARTAYTTGGASSMLQALLSGSADDFLTQAADLDAISRTNNADLRRTQTARLTLAQLENELAQQKAAAADAAQEAAAQERIINEKLAESKRLLSTLQEKERQRLARIAEAERQAAIAAARREAARQASQPSQPSGSTGGGSYADGGSGSDRAAAAVREALRHVGEPYSYSANPPSSWDCSKFTAWAWRAGGVSLTAYSYAQYQQTRRVASNDLRPGDLLFYFGLGAHHVGLYIGGGRMVHAANPSSGVEITSIYESWYTARYSGAGRPG